MEKTYRFSVEVPEDVLSNQTYPIYDDESNAFVGAFTLASGNLVNCFVSGSEYPTAIRISTGEPFYFTPKCGVDGKVSHAIVSEVKLSHMSLEVKKAE